MSDAAVADKPAADASAAAGAEKAADDQSILDGAKASANTGEPKGEAGATKPADAAGKQADGTAKADDKDSAGKPDASKQTGAPEKYEAFKVPEGITLKADVLDKFQAVAKELNLSQDAAQKLVDFQTSAVKTAQEQNLADFKDLQKQWGDETRKELGANADKELSFAALARDKFAPKGSELNEVLNDSGLANHKAIVKLFITLGKAIGEDGFKEGKDTGKGDGTSGTTGKTAAQIIYPNQK
jgi:hypothetical protein